MFKKNFIEKVAPVVQTLFFFFFLKLLITIGEILPALITEHSKEK